MKSKSLLVTTKDQHEVAFLKVLLTKLGYDFRELSTEDAEDAIFLKLMVSEKKEDYVSDNDMLDALSES